MGDEPARFTLLPPKQESAKPKGEETTQHVKPIVAAPVESEPEAVSRPSKQGWEDIDSYSASDTSERNALPPAYTPKKRVSLLPPAFVPESRPATEDAPDLATGDQSQAQIQIANGKSPFAAPELSLDHSTVIIGPDMPPPLDAPSNSPFAPFAERSDGVWDPGAPPIATHSPMAEGEVDSSVPATATAFDGDAEFYRQILQHPDIAAEATVGPSNSQQDSQQDEAPLLAQWWRDFTSKPMRNAVEVRPVSINSLIEAALKYSAQVQVISDTPLIRETAILESDAAFDWSGFMETTWYDTNEPVGSTLTTGGPPRFENKLFEYEYGLRKQTARGGRIEVGQRYGHENSNSIFFIPNDQGTARLTLNYTQPLLRGAGRVYNTSLVLLAQVEAGAARNEFSRELQEHLLEVTRAYWALYLERGALIQKQRLFKRGQEILNELEHRESIDAVMNQIVRARAAVAARESDLFRSAAAVKNAEGRIRALVNAPELACWMSSS